MVTDEITPSCKSSIGVDDFAHTWMSQRPGERVSAVTPLARSSDFSQHSDKSINVDADSCSGNFDIRFAQQTAEPSSSTELRTINEYGELRSVGPRETELLPVRKSLHDRDIHRDVNYAPANNLCEDNLEGYSHPPLGFRETELPASSSGNSINWHQIDESYKVASNAPT